MKTKKELAFDILIKTDGYKLVHADQYPNKTEFIYSNLSTRKSNHKYIKDNIYVFGLNYIKKKIINEWDIFFSLTKKEVTNVLEKFEKFNIKYHNFDSYNIKRFYDLWENKKLPLEIKVVDDGTVVPIGFPIINIYNNDPKFFWMTNYIESYLLTCVWPLITSATISYNLKKIFDEWLEKTSDNKDFSFYQGTDFSYRGMSGSESGLLSGIGHLANFEGSSTLTSIVEFEKNFGRLGTSVPATEHSVMMSFGKEKEKDAYKKLIEAYPKGLLSIVSDTWDLWNVLDSIIPSLKKEIENRDGKLVIRPDSGDPLKIVCGNKKSKNKLEKLGVLRLLDKHFGSTINSKGYKVINNKVGLIYGDSMNFDTIQDLLKGIENLGYSTENIVFGLGATLYQNNNRDTFGFVFKATSIVIDGKRMSMEKDPITNPNKKSHKGLVGLFMDNGKIILKDNISIEEFNSKDNLIK